MKLANPKVDKYEKKTIFQSQFSIRFQKKTPTPPPTRDPFYSYKNDHKLNGVWNKVYSTNDCKTCSEHDKCTKSRVKKIFEPCNPLRWKLKDNLPPRHETKIL